MGNPSKSTEGDQSSKISPFPGDVDSVFVSELTLHQGVLHGYLNSMLPGESDVADVVQRVNLVLWQKRNDFEPGSNFRSWALSVAYWEVRAWMTSRKRNGWLVFDDDLAQAVMDKFVMEEPEAPDEEIVVELQALNRCLAKLKERDRVIVYMYYQCGKSLADSSKTLGRSVGALKVALHRIRGLLRKCVENQMAKEGTGV